MSLTRPHDNCYWLAPARLLAGEFPGALSVAAFRARLQGIVDSGVRYFIDLTQPADGLPPYAHMLPTLAVPEGESVGYEHWGLPDMSVPHTPEHTRQILNRLDALHAVGTPVYLHCWGGIGRTGLIAGCWLVRQGHTGEQALATIAQHWQTVAKRDRYPQSPQTPAQLRYVREWAKFDRAE
jgi:hypothetical protein